MKRKTITIAISCLMVIALVSVGFASWIISAPKTTVVEGSITTENVVDTRIGLEYSWGKMVEVGDEGDKTLQFQADLEDTETPSNVVHFGKSTTEFSEPWLTNSSEKNENLKLYLQLKLKNLIQRENGVVVSHLDSEEGITFTLEDNTMNEEGENLVLNPLYAKAAEAGYVLPFGTYDPENQDVVSVKTIYLVSETIDDVTTYYLSVGDKVKSDDDIVVNEAGETIVVVEIEFKWGVTFGKTNPYDFYNSKKADDVLVVNDESITYADHAVNALKDLHNLNNAKFKLTIKGQCQSVEKGE